MKVVTITNKKLVISLKRNDKFVIVRDVVEGPPKDGWRTYKRTDTSSVTLTSDEDIIWDRTP